MLIDENKKNISLYNFVLHFLDLDYKNATYNINLLNGENGELSVYSLG